MKYEVYKNKEDIVLHQVMTLMKESYWGNQRSEETVRISIENSDCYYAVSDEGKLIGMARVITDYATNYYLCDVIVDEKLRNHGIGRSIITTIINDPAIAHLRGVLLTRDAHGFYDHFGFIRNEERCMERPRADQKAAEAAELSHGEDL